MDGALPALPDLALLTSSPSHQCACHMHMRAEPQRFPSLCLPVGLSSPACRNPCLSQLRKHPSGGARLPPFSRTSTLSPCCVEPGSIAL